MTYHYHAIRCSTLEDLSLAVKELEANTKLMKTHRRDVHLNEPLTLVLSHTKLTDGSTVMDLTVATD